MIGNTDQQSSGAMAAPAALAIANPPVTTEFAIRAPTSHQHPPARFPRPNTEFTANIKLVEGHKGRFYMPSTDPVRSPCDFHPHTPIFRDTGEPSSACFCWNFLNYIPKNAKATYEAMKRQNATDVQLREFFILSLENELEFAGFGNPGTGGTTGREVTLTVHTMGYCVPKDNNVNVLLEGEPIWFAFPNVPPERYPEKAKCDPVQNGAYQPVVTKYDRERILRNRARYLFLKDHYNRIDNRMDFLNGVYANPAIYSIAAASRVAHQIDQGNMGPVNITIQNDEVPCVIAPAGAVALRFTLDINGTHETVTHVPGDHLATTENVLSALHRLVDRVINQGRLSRRRIGNMVDLQVALTHTIPMIPMPHGINRSNDQDPKWPLVDLSVGR